MRRDRHLGTTTTTSYQCNTSHCTSLAAPASQRPLNIADPASLSSSAWTKAVTAAWILSHKCQDSFDQPATMSRPTDHRPMSIDAALDMERQEVLALLGNTSTNAGSPPSARGPASGYPHRGPPPRSMLDIDEEPSTSTTPTSPTMKISPPRTQGHIRSMLDLDGPVPEQRSRGSSPVSASSHIGAASSTGSRTRSDASSHPVEFGPRASIGGGSTDPTANYQFHILPSASASMPKRTTQASQKSPSIGGSLGEALRGNDLSSMQLPGESRRNSSVDNRLGGKSRSPHGRVSSRSRSPAPYSPTYLPKGKAFLNDGQVVDISNAYRRLSDANIALQGSSLSRLPRTKQQDHQSGRLVKSYVGPDGEDLPSSEDEDDDFSTDDEERGRKKAPRPLSPESVGSSRDKSNSQSQTGKRETKSLMAAAEEERESRG